MSRQERLHEVLSTELNPLVLVIEDDSRQHSRPGVETHFSVTAISERFINLTLLARHRLVNTWLSQEFKSGLHALSLHLYTPDEWAKNPNAPSTPTCMSYKKQAG